MVAGSEHIKTQSIEAFPTFRRPDARHLLKRKSTCQMMSQYSLSVSPSKLREKDKVSHSKCTAIQDIFVTSVRQINDEAGGVRVLTVANHEDLETTSLHLSQTSVGRKDTAVLSRLPT
ncbi:hypothetical protein N7G274_007015 [Stereocaulon virgatum]|uniref:Uncharacterized protein n=1 Tax=Stereocaulon virgatum TaxID=373712 RepID=A0ABR4A6U3_9LECA